MIAADKAVSPLIGSILLMAMIMGLISILQSTAVPQWNKAVEVNHLSTLKYEVSSVSEAVSLSSITGNPSKVVLKAGVDYPNYYVLVSPSKASTTVSKKELRVVVDGDVIVNNDLERFYIDDLSSAILVEPNYFYSPRLKLIYEHSAVLRLENSVVLAESDQSSFSGNSISIYILKSMFNSFATTESANLILIPVSIGGRNLFSGKITFECYDESTAEWWNRTLQNIYKNRGVKVSKVGNTISIENLENITLSISVFEVYVLAAGEVVSTPSLSFKLVPITSTYFDVYLYSTVILGARVVDEYGNPVRGLTVNVVDPCNGNSTQVSDHKGEVWYYFSARCPDFQTVTFNVYDSFLDFYINVRQGTLTGGGTFELKWYKDGKPANETEEWVCNEYTCEREFLLNVKYRGSNVVHALVNFATDSSIINILNNTTYTGSDGNASVKVRTSNTTTGLAHLIGIVGDTVKVLLIKVITMLPDLVVLNLTIDPSQPLVGQTVTIRANISNIGNVDAGAFNVTFYVNDSKIYETRILGLAAGGTTILSTVWTPQSAGYYVIRVVADVNGEVRESNENNNERSIFVEVTPSQYELILVVYGPSACYVNVDPPNDNCYAHPKEGRRCQYNYAPGTTVRLNANTQGGIEFLGWGGECAGYGNNRTCILTMITMNPNKFVSARFGKR